MTRLKLALFVVGYVAWVLVMLAPVAVTVWMRKT